MKLILHIGTGKTGTTSIQNVLARQRDRLACEGVLYPRTLGAVNHELAAVCGADFHPGFTPSKARGVTSAQDLETLRSNTARALKEEIARSGCGTVIVSNEHLFEKIRTAAALDRVLALFPPVNDIKVVMYMRHQTDFAAAIFSELLRMGSTARRDTFLDSARTRDLLDYYGGLSVWADGLGDDAIHARAFDRDVLLNGDVIQDFAQICGIDAGFVHDESMSGVRNSRKTLGARATAFLEMLNQDVERELHEQGRTHDIRDFRIVRHRALIVRALERHDHTNDRFCLSAEQDAAVRRVAAPGNALLRDRFGLHLPTSGQAGASQMPDLSKAEMMRFFSALWVETGFPRH